MGGGESFCDWKGKEKNKLFNNGRSLIRKKRRGYERGITLLFESFVVDKTHCILIFNHSLDELSFSKSLCEG